MDRFTLILIDFEGTEKLDLSAPSSCVSFLVFTYLNILWMVDDYILVLVWMSLLTKPLLQPGWNQVLQY
jgi:hypothetical protein